jgi:hypothetical protein
MAYLEPPSPGQKGEYCKRDQKMHVEDVEVEVVGNSVFGKDQNFIDAMDTDKAMSCSMHCIKDGL